jgi:hypothetical protein
MIEFAAVSGRLGMAVFQEDERRYVLRADGDAGAIECRPQDWAEVVANAGPDGILTTNGLDVSRILAVLRVETDRHDTLSMLIAGFDPSFSDDTRSLSIEAAEELLESSDNEAFSRSRLLACPLPADADVTGALRLARLIGGERCAALYEGLLGPTMTNF